MTGLEDRLYQALQDRMVQCVRDVGIAACMYCGMRRECTVLKAATAYDDARDAEKAETVLRAT